MTPGKVSAVIVAATLAGCFEVLPNGVMGAKMYPVRHPVAEKEPPCACDINEPPPIPEVAHIGIDPGKPVIADRGGELLLREYARVRDYAKRCKGA